MNETLEAMARALFKSWFVDFDPVRAKAEGRDPCLPRAPCRPLPGLLRGLGAGGDSEGVGGWPRFSRTPADKRGHTKDPFASAILGRANGLGQPQMIRIREPVPCNTNEVSQSDGHDRECNPNGSLRFAPPWSLVGGRQFRMVSVRSGHGGSTSTCYALVQRTTSAPFSDCFLSRLAGEIECAEHAAHGECSTQSRKVHIASLRESSFHRKQCGNLVSCQPCFRASYAALTNARSP